MLWIRPFVVLLGALIALIIDRKQAREESTDADNLDEAKRKQVRALLDKHRSESA